MITCAEAVRQLWDYLDGIVAETDREAIEAHLSFCRRCCGELDFAEELRAFLAQPDEPDLPADVKTRLLATLNELEKPA
ncbi:MAG TPA: zf-HC2 domain-containing protein [Gaiellaceae bacterium]|nr:zf-HC2 domain-containing protein [Gaiellaceae bacterium]